MSSPQPSAGPSIRLYYALWPSRTVAGGLLEHGSILQAAVRGRIARVDSVHLTLAFLGEVAEARLPELLAPPAAIATEGFALDIDRIGVWHHNGIGWVAPGVTPVALVELQERLSGWLESIGFALEKRAFKPHVTLVRKCTGRAETAAIEPVRWQVDEYVLVQSKLSEAGIRYEIVGRFALGASG